MWAHVELQFNLDEIGCYKAQLEAPKWQKDQFVSSYQKCVKSNYWAKKCRKIKQIIYANMLAKNHISWCIMHRVLCIRVINWFRDNGSIWYLLNSQAIELQRLAENLSFGIAMIVKPCPKTRNKTPVGIYISFDTKSKQWALKWDQSHLCSSFRLEMAAW